MLLGTFLAARAVVDAAATALLDFALSATQTVRKRWRQPAEDWGATGAG